MIYIQMGDSDQDGTDHNYHFIYYEEVVSYGRCTCCDEWRTLKYRNTNGDLDFMLEVIHED